MAPAPATLVLWDIDNTLLYTGGAGSIGMRRAFHDLYGVDDAFGRVEFSGRTDTAIFRDAARMHGIDESRLGAEQARFLDAYVPHLASALKSTDGALMPGVAAVLAALSARRCAAGARHRQRSPRRRVEAAALRHRPLFPGSARIPSRAMW